MIFTLGAEEYGMLLFKVREIIRMQTITPVFQMPEFVKGVFNLKGKVILMIDLRVKFIPGSGQSIEKRCNIVVEVEEEDWIKTLGPINS